jgi:hypothetical protein
LNQCKIELEELKAEIAKKNEQIAEAKFKLEQKVDSAGKRE